MLAKSGKKGLLGGVSKRSVGMNLSRVDKKSKQRGVGVGKEMVGRHMDVGSGIP